MSDLLVICPNKNISSTLHNMIDVAVEGFNHTIIDGDTIKSPEYNFTNTKLLFCLEIDDLGFDLDMLSFLKELKATNPNAFEDSHGAVLVHSSSELYTKRAAQDLIFIANYMGCTFIGHPIVEATASFNNLKTWQKTIDLPLEEICYTLSTWLVDRLAEFTLPKLNKPNIVVLYSAPHAKSNTVALWKMIRNELSDYNIKEIDIENGEILDCIGCPYKACLHFGREGGCFYGGQMVVEVLPAIEEADVLIWLCPNYNDSIAANLCATINRLTVLYRQMSFHEKIMFGIVVSGNSGSDSVAKQLLGALNINKGFILPPDFCMSETANDPDAIYGIQDIETKAKTFAEHIKSLI